MKQRDFLAAGLLAWAAAFSAQATTLALAPDGVWNVFDVAPELSPTSSLGWLDIDDGSSLSFTFTVTTGFVGTVTVVDGGFSGDRFAVTANGTPRADTSAATNSYPNSIGLEFDAALANPSFSRGIYTFSAGSYTLTGALLTSALDDAGLAINATVGALRLQVSPVPELPVTAMWLAGVGLLTVVRRARAHVRAHARAR